MHMLEGLNRQQSMAVTEHARPLLVLAGAGSGKTRVIIHKIAYCVRSLYQDPAAVLAVTFTNKAADEMRERLAEMIPPQQAQRAVMRTFHSFGAWVLRRHGELLGLSRDFTIYDDDDALTLLHSLYPDYKRRELSPFMKAISRAKDLGLRPGDDISEAAGHPKVPEMYRAYQRRLEEIGNVDFGDLISRVIELFAGNPEILDSYRQRFSTILVDEYQDTNTAQFELLRQLYRPGTHLCVVGDDDQSIYRFRGAEVRNILYFPEYFPDTQVIRLEQNYRSTGRILAIAGEVVKHNSGRHEKTLWSERPEGQRARLAFVANHMAEAEYCARLVKREGDWNNTAVLYRTNAQSAAFETVFIREQIPYKIVGALRFYEREEVKDSLALLSLIMNPGDEISFKRMVNKPARGIGKASIGHILSMGERNLIACCEEALPSLQAKAGKGVREFLAWYKEAEQTLDGMSLPAWITSVLTASGLAGHHRKQDEISSTQKEKNLEELVNAALPYPSGREGLREFLEHMELDRARIGRKDPADDQGVTLITMHNTKGLEFSRVIITGLEEGLFPGRANSGQEELEEERRIFYVSITRAKDELYLTSCRKRFLWGQSMVQQPSRFLKELPEEHIVVEGEASEDFGVPVREKKTIQVKKPDPAAGDDGTPCQFSRGERVFHDSYGTGHITSSWREHGREVVIVQFETGHTARFLPEFSPLEKIAQD